MFSVFACSDEAEEIVESITESTSSESDEKEAHSDEDDHGEDEDHEHDEDEDHEHDEDEEHDHDEEKEAHSDEDDHGEFTFGLILVGPRDDKGWSQAHFEGGEYVEEITGGEMIVADFINPADSPNLTVDQVASDMIDEGAQLIIATSDDMKDGILAAAEMYPDIPMIWASGDSAKADGKGYREDLENLGNIMGRMEYGKNDSWLCSCPQN